MCDKNIEFPRAYMFWTIYPYTAPNYPLQARIVESWFVHEPHNLLIEPNPLTLINNVVETANY